MRDQRSRYVASAITRNFSPPQFEVDESAKDRHNTIWKTCDKRDNDYAACCQYHFEEMMIVNTYNQFQLLLEVIQALQGNGGEIPSELSSPIVEKMYRPQGRNPLR